MIYRTRYNTHNTSPEELLTMPWTWADKMKITWETRRWAILACLLPSFPRLACLVQVLFKSRGWLSCPGSPSQDLGRTRMEMDRDCKQDLEREVVFYLSCSSYSSAACESCLQDLLTCLPTSIVVIIICSLMLLTLETMGDCWTKEIYKILLKTKERMHCQHNTNKR